MSNILEYKKYIAVLNFSAEDDAVVGRVVNSNAIIGFHGNHLAELKRAFEDVIDAYLEACEESNIEPEKPYSGKFILRIPTQLHKALSIKAAQEGESLNSLTVALLESGLAGLNEARTLFP
jgi:predicted HicB family RNase H-like nuclease